MKFTSYSYCTQSENAILLIVCMKINRNSRKWKIHNDYVETVDLISKKKSEKKEVSIQIIIVILRRIHLSI